MKNLAKKSLVVVMLGMSLLTVANETELNLSEKNVTMRFDRVKQGSVLTIIDKKGLVLYNEEIRKSGEYSKRFDLTSLPDGDYFFEMDSEFEIVVIPFNVESNEVIFNKKEEKVIYKPQVRTKGDLVYVSRVASHDSELSYKIYFTENYDLIRSESFETSEGLGKIYDFSTSKKGEYIFMFKFEGRTFNKTIKI